MVPCRIAIDTVPQIIQHQRCGKSNEEEKPQTIGTGILGVAATRNHNYFCYLTKKLTAITIVVVALYAVSSVSAFTQPQNRIGATTTTTTTRSGKSTSTATEGRNVPSGTIIHSKASFLTPSKSASAFSTKKSLSSTRLFMSTENKSPKSADQQEWRAVFLALQLYKAAYGDLKVPPHFVVPAAAPWPGMLCSILLLSTFHVCKK
ncbi:MAG: hypothetical protein ACI90V_000790 [Bacillariaceae sp.]|jgi:hypothetical protein